MQGIIKLFDAKLKAIIAIIVSLMVVVGVVAGLNARHEYVNSEAYYVQGLLKSRKAGNESNEDISFKSFCLRDTDLDGYTEELTEIDQELGNTDYMFVELSVNTAGSLKNARFTIGDSNFKWKTAIIANDIVKNNYIGYTNTVEFNDLTSGTQILLYGKIESEIANNIYDYNKESLVRLTGTFVDDDGNEFLVQKDSNLKINWYSTTSTSISNNRLTTYNINNALTDNGFKASFSVNVSETTPTYPINKALMMKKQESIIEIPKLNGYIPTTVTVTSEDVEQSYNESTRILTLVRETEVDENGNITKCISRDNTYSLTVTYPIEAYETLGLDSVMLNFRVTGKSTVFNSTKVGNLESSASSTLSVIYKEIAPTVPVERVYNTWSLQTLVGTYSKKDSYYNYRISKENILNLYHGSIYDEVEDTYSVSWEVSIGQKEKISKIILEDEEIDKFNNQISMEDYESTKGIYFVNANELLGNDGKIELYNENNELIETFTTANWGMYSSSYPYKVDTKRIKVVTSAPIANTYFLVYQIKELDDEKIVADFTEEEFENLTSVYTHVKGNIELLEGASSNTGISQTKMASAIFDKPVSLVSFYSTPTQVYNQNAQNLTLSISTSSSNDFEKKWKNGSFLIELPPETINAEIASVFVSNDNVNIISTLLYKENKKLFVRIDTENEKPETYTITVQLTVNGNPLYSTRTGTIKLYASNKNCENYITTVSDNYDLNGNGSVEDRVAYRTRSVEWIAAQGIITAEYISEYDEEESITIAPNVAEIDRSDEARIAKINMSIANNYPETISEIVILGKIPFKGNTDILNGDDLKSQFNACMRSAITIPDNLQQYAEVYYSENENPTKDLTDLNNGWTQTVTDWTKVRAYLIDLGDYVLSNTGNKVFSYEVEVPARTGYNKATFATHAVYYSLDTELGKYQTKTQPNKVGLQVVSKYGMELTKNKYQLPILVKGATYKFVTKDAIGEEVIRTATTDQNGHLLLNSLFIGREYTISEIISPNDYELNDTEIKINTVVEEIDGLQELKVNVIKGNFNDSPQVTIDSNNNFLVKANVQDEAKYKLMINTLDKETNNNIVDVRYAIQGKGQGKIYRDNNNQVIIEGLYLNEEYELQLIRAVGYYTDESTRTFKIVRDSVTNNLKVVTEDNELNGIEIEENVSGQSIVSLIIEREKIPTYKLKILKIEEPANEDDELNYLSGAQYKITSEDLLETKFYTVEQDGMIIPDLYTYVANKSTISGKYKIQEIGAPEGYSNNAEEIEFYVEKTNDELTVKIQNQNLLRTVYSAEIENDTLNLILQDKPLFTVTKIDSEQVDEYGSPLLLPNAKFIIIELDENNCQIDFAKDENGNYVGEYDEETEQYIVITDRNGRVNVPLRAGNYMIKEIGYPEGYFSENNIQLFKIKGKAFDETNNSYSIEYIEDLVEISGSVNDGNTYENKTLRLLRTLDFNNEECYRDSTSKKYGDINKNGIVEEIKTELMTGEGFVPIGNNSDEPFKGTFDGQGYEIQNVYINTENLSVGFLGYAENATIINLGISGSITNRYDENTQKGAGGLVGVGKKCIIKNCYNKCEVNCTSETYLERNYAGGIIGESDGCIIMLCYNTGDITCIGNETGSWAVAGGIVGCSEISGSKIIACYNTGTISSTGYTGGLAGIAYRSETLQSGYSEICNCYNLGQIRVLKYYGGGLVGRMWRWPNI